MRVVLDTNVIVAGMAYPAGPPGRIVAAWRSGALQVVLSPWILAECARVLPRLRPYTSLTPAEITELVEQMEFAADLVESAGWKPPRKEAVHRAARSTDRRRNALGAGRAGRRY